MNRSRQVPTLSEQIAYHAIKRCVCPADLNRRCIEQRIPVIAVRNRNIMKNDLDELDFEHGKFFRADNYLEAVGIMQMLKEGIALDTVTTNRTL